MDEGEFSFENHPLPGVLKSAQYFSHSKQLRVTFRDGRFFVHANVPPALYAALKGASQPSAYWAGTIRQATVKDGTEKLYPVVARG